MKRSLPLSTSSSAEGLTASSIVSERAQWVDVAKGLGIALVVLGHVLAGMIDAGMAPEGTGWTIVHFAIYTFHMPLFMLCAGCFIGRRVQHAPANLALQSVTRIAWPFLLWSVVQTTVITMAGDLVNRPGNGSLIDPWKLVIQPPGQFWFLECLFLFQISALVLLPKFGPLALLALSLTARLLCDVTKLPYVIDLLFRFAPFFALGVMFGPVLVAKISRLSGSRTFSLLFITTSAWLASAAFGYLLSHRPWGPASLPAAVFGIAAALLLSGALSGRMSASLAFLGQRSLSVYLLHIFFAAGTRIALQHIWPQADPWLVLVMSCILGIGAPLLVYALVKRLGFTRQLGLG